MLLGSPKHEFWLENVSFLKDVTDPFPKLGTGDIPYPFEQLAYSKFT